MNINLGDILAAASKRMDIANEANRMVNDRYSSRSYEDEARENNRRMVNKMDKMGMDVTNIRGKF